MLSMLRATDDPGRSQIPIIRGASKDVDIAGQTCSIETVENDADHSRDRLAGRRLVPDRVRLIGHGVASYVALLVVSVVPAGDLSGMVLYWLVVW